MILIGLGYKARQGKNYVANYMKELDNSIKLYAFADELKLYCKKQHKELVQQWHQANPNNLYLKDPKDDPIYGYTQILQWYGTDVARRNDPDTWVKALDKRIKEENPDVAIVTDVRFQNEADCIKKAGGFMVEVVRLNEDNSRYLDKGRDPNHPSETALDSYEDWDFIIVAKDGDLKGLKAKSIGVYNLISKPEDYLGYIEDYPEYMEGIEGMVDISDLSANSDIFSFVDEPDVINFDNQGDGFK